MAGLFSNMISVEDEIRRCLQREAEEREAAAKAADACARDAHAALAERYADRASMLAERSDHAPTPSGVWPAAAPSRRAESAPDIPA